MTTNSVRPEALRDHAARLDADGRGVDEAVRAVARCQSAYVDRCGDGHPVGRAAMLGQICSDATADLACAVRSVADAFERADRSGAVRRVADGALASALVRIAPGFTGDVGIREAVAHEQGRLLGAELAHAAPSVVVERLQRSGSAISDPAFAAGLLEGIGASGLGRLAGRAQRAGNAIGGSAGDESELWRQLGRVLGVASRSVHGLPHPGARPQIDPAGLDLGLVDRLGSSWSGRLALRNLAEHLRRPPTALTAALADALLLGPTALSDVGAADGALSTVGLIAAPGIAGEARALALLADDPMASFRLELLHPKGDSPALLLLQRDGWGPAPDAAARNLRNTTVTAVARGWAAPWADPLAGTGAAYRHQPVPRVLDGLIDEVIAIDGPTTATPALSRSLAAVVATHPAAFEVATAEALIATTDERRTAPSRFYQAIARDEVALERVTKALAEQHRNAIISSVASRPPGATTVHAALVDTALSHRSVELLITGAHDAGREHHVGVVIASVLGGAAVGSGLPALGGKVAGPAGAWVGNQAGKAARDKIADYRSDHEDTYDGRERGAEQELERNGPLAGAIAMSRDPAWSPLLRFPPGGIRRDQLAELDVGGRDQDHRAFLAWLADQDDPRVTEVLQALTPRSG